MLGPPDAAVLRMTNIPFAVADQAVIVAPTTGVPIVGFVTVKYFPESASEARLEVNPICPLTTIAPAMSWYTKRCVRKREPPTTSKLQYEKPYTAEGPFRSWQMTVQEPAEQATSNPIESMLAGTWIFVPEATVSVSDVNA